MSSEKETALSLLLDTPIPSARGGRRPPTHFQYVRELNENDLDLIINPPAVGFQAPPIQRLRHSHHFAARLLAEGRKAVEVSEITGYSQSRLSILKNDPAFQELIEYYRTQVEQTYTDVHQRLAMLGIDTIEELQRRIDEEPEKFSNAELRQLMGEVLERSTAPAKGHAKGQGQQSAGLQININFKQAEGTEGPTIDMELDDNGEAPDHGPNAVRTLDLGDD